MNSQYKYKYKYKFKFKKRIFLDIFIILNFLFLSLDIFYAHSINKFEKLAEWYPLYFSIIAFIFLSINLFLIGTKWQKLKNYISVIFATLSIVIGTLGLYYHLASQFFQVTTLKSLIYTAPLIAPLSYTALGLLLYLNLLVSESSKNFGLWLVVLSYIGFAGIFLLSLLDHAQNGYFYSTEWIPVLSSILVLAFIPIIFLKNLYITFKLLLHFIIGLQFGVGVLGLIFHLYPIMIKSQNTTIISRILYGPPLLAPLLFCNLALLMVFGWWCIINKDEYEITF